MPLQSHTTTPPTGPIHPPSLHDALPISPEPPLPRCEVELHRLEIGHQEIRGRHRPQCGQRLEMTVAARTRLDGPSLDPPDRKSTRLNSSHPSISYAVFCLKKKTAL